MLIIYLVAFFWLLYEHTYLLTAWSRVLLQKLTGFAANQEIPCILWNPTVHYRTHKRPPPVPILSQLHPVPTTPSHFLKIHLNIILPSTSWSPQWSLSLGFPHQNLVHTSPFLHTCHMSHPSHSSRFYHPHNNGWWVQMVAEEHLVKIILISMVWNIYLFLFEVSSCWLWTQRSPDLQYVALTVLYFSTFRAVIRRIEVIKTPTCVLECMNVNPITQ